MSGRRRALVLVGAAVTIAAGVWWARARLLGHVVARVRGAKHEAQIVHTWTPFPLLFMFCEQAYVQVDGVSGRIWHDLYQGRGGYEARIDRVTWTGPHRLQLRRTPDDDSPPDILTFDAESRVLAASRKER